MNYSINACKAEDYIRVWSGGVMDDEDAHDMVRADKMSSAVAPLVGRNADVFPWCVIALSLANALRGRS